MLLGSKAAHFFENMLTSLRDALASEFNPSSSFFEIILLLISSRATAPSRLRVLQELGGEIRFRLEELSEVLSVHKDLSLEVAKGKIQYSILEELGRVIKGKIKCESLFGSVVVKEINKFMGMRSDEEDL